MRTRGFCLTGATLILCLSSLGDMGLPPRASIGDDGTTATEKLKETLQQRREADGQQSSELNALRNEMHALREEMRRIQQGLERSQRNDKELQGRQNPAARNSQYTSKPETVRAESRFQLLYFTAKWCGPCQQMNPIISKASNVDIRVLDADEKQEALRQWNVDSLPTMILTLDGNEVSRKIGLQNEQAMNELFRSIATMSRFVSGQEFSRSDRKDLPHVITYSVADILVTAPSGLPDEKIQTVPKIAMSRWLSMIDSITSTIEPKCWKVNGGDCMITAHEQNYSLIIRAPEAIHDRVASHLASLRNKNLVQISTEVSWYQNVDDDFLATNEFAIEFNPSTGLARLSPHTAKRFIELAHNKKVNEDDWRASNLQIVRFSDRDAADENPELGHQLYLRTASNDGQDLLKVSVTINPLNLINEIVNNSVQVEDGGYLLLDVTQALVNKQPARKKFPQEYALIRLTRFVQEEAMERVSDERQ